MWAGKKKKNQTTITPQNTEVGESAAKNLSTSKYFFIHAKVAAEETITTQIRYCFTFSSVTKLIT